MPLFSKDEKHKRLLSQVHGMALRELRYSQLKTLTVDQQNKIYTAQYYCVKTRSSYRTSEEHAKCIEITKKLFKEMTGEELKTKGPAPLGGLTANAVEKAKDLKL